MTKPVKLISAQNSKYQSHLYAFTSAISTPWKNSLDFMGQVMLLFILKTIRLKCQFVWQLLKAGPIVNAYGIQGSLPNHDHVMAPQHKLIPSVILDMCAQEKDSSGNAVTYSVPTYCAIRKLKHSGSIVFHYLQNMKHIRSLDIFDDSLNNDTGKSVSGGNCEFGHNY